jgi:hypothetical protein
LKDDYLEARFFDAVATITTVAIIIEESHLKVAQLHLGV